VITVVEYREETVVAIRITEEVKRRIDQLQAAGKCLGCEEVIPAGKPCRCGQCSGCYNRSLRAIERKPSLRAELIRKGMMLPPGKPGPKPNDLFEQKLAEI
jgi:hypothetical protein